MTKIRQLEDSNSEVFYPQTHYGAVIDSQGETLQEELSNIWAEIEDLKANGGGGGFSISAKISSDKSVYEYKDGTISTGTLTMTTSYKGKAIPDSDIREYQVSGKNIEITPSSDLYPKSLQMILDSDSSHSGYIEHSATLSVSAYSQATTSTVSFCSVAPSWIGWSEIDTPSEEIIDMVGMKRLVTKNLSGSYEFFDVPEKHYFWIVVPVSPNISGYSKVTTFGFAVNTKNLGIVRIGDIDYKFIRTNNNSGDNFGSWTLELSK